MHYHHTDVLAMILAGGRGSRLIPLTAVRAKPAVPFGGKYRIIDIVLSNFVNSGFFRIKVLTQYKSDSLNRHIDRGWRLASILDQYIELVPAQQRHGPHWYEGSADAVWQNINLVEDEGPRDVCIFGGDHIYRMDVGQMLDFHREMNAALTVAAVPVPIDEASAFGVIEIDASGRMIGFEEKPERPKPMPNDRGRALVSMGNYIFKADVLYEALERDAHDPDSVHDFGKDIIKGLYPNGDVYVYDFNTNRVPGALEREVGYWRDIGTIDAYMAAHMDLVSADPVFNLYNRLWPIRTVRLPSPPAKFVHEAGDRVGTATESIVSGGCIISGGRIRRSVLSPDVRINSFSHIEGSILLERVVVGRHAKLRNCIVDKGVVIPEGLEIGYHPDFDDENFYVSPGGIVIIQKEMDLSGLEQ